MDLQATGPAKWLMVLPPEGAARQVGEMAWDALCGLLPPERRKLFDIKPYLDGFDKLLKNPTDDMVVDLANQSLVVQCLDFQATHLLVLALAPITAFTVGLLRRNGVITAHWFYEDFRQAKYWSAVVPAYQHFLAIQRGPVEEACRVAGTRFHYLPTAAMLPPRASVRPWRERPDGIAFIGFPSAYRVEVLEAIVREGLPLRIAGAGWEKYRGPLESFLTGKGWFGAEEAGKLLDGARIGLHVPAEDPRADRGNSHVSPRLYDILASGCYLLSEEAPLIRESLGPCEFREFRGPAEAVRAAKALLTEGVSESALASNRAHALAEHTFTRRMRDIMDRIG